jgi:amylosucrase
MAREDDHTWFLSQEWVGMALYTDGFAGDLKGLLDRLPYLGELGVNMVHVMPILQCPEGASDGGYAVSNFRAIDPRAGTLDDLCELGAAMRKRGMLLTLDVVVNHTSNEHPWAQQARAGDPPTRTSISASPTGRCRTCSRRPCPRSSRRPAPATSPGTSRWAAG